jgi:hypothetical protein
VLFGDTVMMAFEADDFRRILTKLNEYMVAIAEDPATNEPDQDIDTQTSTSKEKDKKDDLSVDDVMTKPAGADKIIGSINADNLSTTLGIPEDRRSDFKSGLAALAKDSPSLSTSQAMALAIGFSKMLTLDTQRRVRVGSMIQPVSEDYDQKFDQKVSAPKLIASLRAAGKSGSATKSAASKLIATLIAGGRDRRLNAGLQGIFNAVGYLLDIGKSGDRGEMLYMLDDFENKYEGDDHAFDQTLFPEFLIDMRRLGRLLLDTSEKSSSN